MACSDAPCNRALDPSPDGPHLGLIQLTMTGVGAIIGAGIPSLAAAVARDTTGPTVLISFLVAG